MENAFVIGMVRCVPIMTREIEFSLIGLVILLVLTNVSLYVFTWLQARVMKDLANRIEKLEKPRP